MIIHYQIAWANDLKEEGHIPVPYSYISILDLSALPRHRRYDIGAYAVEIGAYPWFSYCGKITKIQMET